MLKRLSPKQWDNYHFKLLYSSLMIQEKKLEDPDLQLFVSDGVLNLSNMTNFDWYNAYYMYIHLCMNLCIYLSSHACIAVCNDVMQKMKKISQGWIENGG